MSTLRYRDFITIIHRCRTAGAFSLNKSSKNKTKTLKKSWEVGSMIGFLTSVPVTNIANMILAQ